MKSSYIPPLSSIFPSHLSKELVPIKNIDLVPTRYYNRIIDLVLTRKNKIAKHMIYSTELCNAGPEKMATSF